MNNHNLYAILAVPGDYLAAGRADLPGWKQDMEMMEKALVEGLSFPAQQIRKLGRDGRCGVRDFVRETAGLARALGEEDLLLVYFSGHGSAGNLCFSDAPLDLQSLIDHLAIRWPLSQAMAFLYWLPPRKGRGPSQETGAVCSPVCWLPPCVPAIWSAEAGSPCRRSVRRPSAFPG